MLVVESQHCSPKRIARSEKTYIHVGVQFIMRIHTHLPRGLTIRLSERKGRHSEGDPMSQCSIQEQSRWGQSELVLLFGAWVDKSCSVMWDACGVQLLLSGTATRTSTLR